MRTYKTTRWLWFLMSVSAFVAIGFVPWIDMKGGNSLFGLSVLLPLLDVVTGRAPLGWIQILVPWFIGWIIVASALGWCLQSILTILFSRHEKSKPLA